MMTDKSIKTFDGQLLFLSFLFFLGSAAFLYPFEFLSLLSFQTFTLSKYCGLAVMCISASEIYACIKQTNLNSACMKGDNSALIIYLALLLTYCFSLFYFSYYLTTGLFMAVSFAYLLGKKGIFTAASVTCSWLVLVYFVFEKIFTIVLP